MSLSCSCDYDPDSVSWWYLCPSDINFTPLKTSKRKRCCSCKILININNSCLSFSRYRAARSDIEERIFGDEVRLSDWYLCESCGEIFLNLNVLEYCYYMGDDLRENLQDYWDLTGFNPAKYELKLLET